MNSDTTAELIRRYGPTTFPAGRRHGNCRHFVSEVGGTIVISVFGRCRCPIPACLSGYSRVLVLDGRDVTACPCFTPTTTEAKP